MGNQPLMSMTGFGSASCAASEATHGGAIQVEIKTVNHRFLDVSIKSPREYSSFEQDIRVAVQPFFQRGRVDVMIQRLASPLAIDGGLIQTTQFEAWFKTGMDLLEQKAKISTLTADRRAEIVARLVLDICRRNDVQHAANQAAVIAESERSLLFALVRQAAESARAMRMKEGSGLSVEIAARSRALRNLQRACDARARSLSGSVRQRLLDRVRALAPEVRVDEQRLASEVVLLADRADVSEELQRLGSHLDQLDKSLEFQPSGKRFDFLLQEISREISTLGAKAQDAEMQQLVVEAKIEAEKLREQAQNVE